jgi:hypothetical protein
MNWGCGSWRLNEGVQKTLNGSSPIFIWLHKNVNDFRTIELIDYICIF